MQECGWEGQSERANRWFEAEAASARVLLLRQGKGGSPPSAESASEASKACGACMHTAHVR